MYGVLGLFIARENTYEHAQTVISSFEKILEKSEKIVFSPIFGPFWVIFGIRRERNLVDMTTTTQNSYLIFFFTFHLVSFKVFK